MKQTKFSFDLPVSIFKEGDQFIAYAYALDLSTSGKSLEEAKKRFNEAAYLFFEELEKQGSLDDALADLGWEKKGRKRWLPPVQVAHELENFAIPA